MTVGEFLEQFKGIDPDLHLAFTAFNEEITVQISPECVVGVFTPGTVVMDMKITNHYENKM